MKFFFLRHTSLNIDPDVFYGQTDLDVSSSFENEVKGILKKIKTEEINIKKIKIYSSPLKRCIKLAKKISSDFEVDERLKELNLGDWEMKKMSSIPKKLKDEWENDLMNFKIPNGETNQMFLKRLNGFLDSVKKEKQDCLIVSHAGSINGMLSNLTRLSFNKLVKNYWEKISHGSLSLVEGEREKFEIKFIGK